MLGVVALLAALPACRRPDVDIVTHGAAERIHGPLRTEGSRILDRDGEPVRFLGVGVPGMNRTVNGWFEPTPETYDEVAGWGFNSVRVTITWANLEPFPPVRNTDGSVTHRWDQAYLAALDGIVQEFARRDVAVILVMNQWHWSPAFRFEEAGRVVWGKGMPAWLYAEHMPLTASRAKASFFANEGRVWEGFAEAWKLVASRYEGNRAVVGFDVFNEPYYGGSGLPGPDSIPLDAFYREIGAAIRSVNSSALLIFEDTQFRGEAVFGLHAPPPFEGVVYSFHLYTPTWEPDGLERTRAYLDRARRWSVPIWIGEFNRFGSGDSALGEWAPPLLDMLAFCRANEIGWTYWAYQGPDGLKTKNEGANVELVRALESGF